MNVQAMLAPDTSAPLGQTRARVLDLLRAAGGPLGVQEVADRTGLHPNTARFHLDGLAEAGLVIREPQPRATPGRPSMAYRAADGGDPAGARRYRLLAEMLTSLITGLLPNPGKAATEAGREWGGYLTEQPPPYQRLSAGQAIEQLTEIMEKLGFTPQAAADGTRIRLCLHQCPFREVAQHHQDVVCALHLGLIQGALAKMRAPVTADRLHPFAEPGLCVAHMTAREDPGSTTRPDSRAKAAAGAHGRGQTLLARARLNAVPGQSGENGSLAGEVDAAPATNLASGSPAGVAAVAGRPLLRG